MSTATARTTSSAGAQCRCRTTPDVTDIRNAAAGLCVLCGRWVLKRAGWRVRGRGRWLGVCCDGHDNPAAPGTRPGAPVVRPSVAERAAAKAAAVRAGDVPDWVAEQL